MTWPTLAFRILKQKLQRGVHGEIGAREPGDATNENFPYVDVMDANESKEESMKLNFGVT